MPNIVITGNPPWVFSQRYADSYTLDYPADALIITGAYETDAAHLGSVSQNAVALGHNVVQTNVAHTSGTNTTIVIVGQKAPTERVGPLSFDLIDADIGVDADHSINGDVVLALAGGRILITALGHVQHTTQTVFHGSFISTSADIVLNGHTVAQTNVAHIGRSLVVSFGAGTLNTNTAHTGTHPIVVLGHRVTQANVAHGGAPVGRTLIGNVAHETERVFAASNIDIKALGSHVTETTTVHAGTSIKLTIAFGHHVNELDKPSKGSFEGADILIGSIALETDVAQLGALTITAVGGSATETNTPTGQVSTVDAVVPGHHVTEITRVHSGSQKRVIIGAHAQETSVAYAGGGGGIAFGSRASEVDVAHKRIVRRGKIRYTNPVRVRRGVGVTHG